MCLHVHIIYQISRYSVKKVLLKVLQNSHENARVGDKSAVEHHLDNFYFQDVNICFH